MGFVDDFKVFGTLCNEIFNDDDEPNYQRSRIYSDEVPRPDRDFMRRQNNRLPEMWPHLPDGRLLVIPLGEKRRNKTRLKQWKAKMIEKFGSLESYMRKKVLEKMLAIQVHKDFDNMTRKTDGLMQFDTDK